MEHPKTIIWSTQANMDLLDALDFIQKNWNTKIAGKFLNDIEKKISLIQKFPFIGISVKYPKNCRKILVQPYHLLFYRVTSEHIEIIRLFDGRQNLELLK
jgi:plasmid stabilization system protein ParE